MAPCLPGPPPLPSLPSIAAVRRGTVLLLAVCLSAGCSTVYYAAMSQLGWAKADLLANRIQLARDAMDQTRLHLADALGDFAEARSEPDERGLRHQSLRASYAHLEADAATVAKRRSGVEHAGTALFDEWQQDIAAATAPGARNRKQQAYNQLRPPYDRLLDAMRGAEASLAPVLRAMQKELAALQPSATAASTPGIDAAEGDRAVRNLQLAVALSDQYIAELENAP